MPKNTPHKAYSSIVPVIRFHSIQFNRILFDEFAFDHIQSNSIHTVTVVFERNDFSWSQKMIFSFELCARIFHLYFMIAFIGIQSIFFIFFILYAWNRRFFVTVFSICYAMLLIVFSAILFIGDVVDSKYPYPQVIRIFNCLSINLNIFWFCLQSNFE